MSNRLFDECKKKAIMFFDDKYLNNILIDKKSYFKLNYDMFEVQENYLSELYHIKIISAEDTALYIHILQLINNNTLSNNTKKIIINELLYKDYINLENAPAIDRKIEELLKKFVEIGWIKKIREKKTDKFEIAHNPLYDLNKDELFKLIEAILFFNRSSLLTAPGYTLEKVIENILFEKYNITTPPSNFFIIKDYHMQQILDEEVIFKLISCIKDNKAITFTYNGKKYTPDDKLHPKQIFLDIYYGRWYLLAIKLNKTTEELLFSFRIDKITDLKEYKSSRSISQNIKRINLSNKIKLKNIWSSSFSNTIEHVELLFKLEKNDRYILHRLKAEKRHGNLEKINDTTYKYTIDVTSSNEMIPWIRSFTGYVKVIAPLSLKKDLYKDWEEQLENYGII